MLERVRCSVRSISKSSGCQLARACPRLHARAAPARCGSCAAGRAGTGRRTRTASCRRSARGRARSRCTWCWPTWSLVSLEKRSRSALEPIARRPLRRQLQAALALLDQARLGEHPGELGEPLERAGGVVAEQVADAVHVGLGERAGVRGVAQQVLELVEVAEVLHRLHRLAEPERVLPGEVVGLLPAHLREQLAQVAAELVHLPAQVHVAEQLVGQLLQLGPLLGRHRVEHRLHRRHALRPAARAARRGSAGSPGRSPRTAP